MLPKEERDREKSSFDQSDSKQMIFTFEQIDEAMERYLELKEEYA